MARRVSGAWRFHQCSHGGGCCHCNCQPTCFGQLMISDCGVGRALAWGESLRHCSRHWHGPRGRQTANIDDRQVPSCPAARQSHGHAPTGRPQTRPNPPLEPPGRTSGWRHAIPGVQPILTGVSWLDQGAYEGGGDRRPTHTYRHIHLTHIHIVPGPPRRRCIRLACLLVVVGSSFRSAALPVTTRIQSFWKETTN